MADALIDAAVKNDVTLVQRLIGTGVDVNGVDYTNAKSNFSIFLAKENTIWNA